MSWTPAVRAIIYARSGECCERCGMHAHGGSVHHRRPRGMGGNRSRETGSVPNGVLLCGSGNTGCHGWVESHRDVALEQGWLVRQGVDPATVPILHVTHGLVWLSQDGMYLYDLAYADELAPSQA